MRASRLLLFSSLLLAACSTPPDAASTDPVVAEGKYLVEVHCAACHAVGTSDHSPNKEAPPLRRLSIFYPVSDLAQPLSQGIVVGHPQMPEFRFRPEDVKAIISYLESIQVK